MKLIIEPDAGEGPLLSAIKHARKLIDVLIFRLDGHNLTMALEDAVARGVTVRVLIAARNHGGTSHLRRLERRMLDVGAVVSRTKDDLVRYHGKMMIIDNKTLHLYGFNFTRLDLLSRSFGIVTTDRRLVREALKLFEADGTRHDYKPGLSTFIVSPLNSRERLSVFIRGAKKQLLIYDPRMSDPDMLGLIRQRANAGVDVRIIGKVLTPTPNYGLRIEHFPGRRLHVRAIIRDGVRAFVGSQSLGKIELDHRREIGVILQDRTIVDDMRSVFEQDWALTDLGRREALNVQEREKLQARPIASLTNPRNLPYASG
jgi:cardiolipin synthase